jgi:capsular exopolysaccharide synthesis family protein
MAKPLDNPANAAIRTAVENGPREPVVEFARKKSPSHVSDSFDDHQQLGVAIDRDFSTLQMADLPQVSVPRDTNKPFVTVNERYAKAALESYKSLRTRLLRSQTSQGFRSVAVTSVGRSEGKTLTAFNLACCCAQIANFSVLLIDGDLRNRSLTKLIGRLPSVGLADVMSGTASCEEAVVRTDMTNMYVMGAGKSDVPPTELFSTEMWGEVIRWGAQHFKLVLVDALSMGEFADFELIAPECEGVLMVVRARSTNREDLKMALEQLDATKLLGIVWNGSEYDKAKSSLS